MFVCMLRVQVSEYSPSPVTVAVSTEMTAIVTGTSQSVAHYRHEPSCSISTPLCGAQRCPLLTTGWRGALPHCSWGPWPTASIIGVLAAAGQAVDHVHAAEVTDSLQCQIGTAQVAVVAPAAPASDMVVALLLRRGRENHLRLLVSSGSGLDGCSGRAKSDLP